jgi:hypothetical protein
MSSCSLMHRVFPPFKPPDGGCPQPFRLVVGGTQLRGSWYLSAIVRLQGFSSGSPAAPLRRRSPETVTTSPWVGRSKPGCDLGPTLSFKDVHHPRWGGGRAEPELYLPRGFVGHPLLRRSGEGAHWPCGRVGLRQRGAGRRRASSAPACRARRLGSRCPLLLEGGCRAVCTGGPPKMSRATRAAFVFWGGPAFAPVWCLRAEVGAPLVREDLSGDLPEG